MNNNKIGIDLGGTKLLGILVNNNNTIINRKKINVQKNIDITGMISEIVNLIYDLSQNSKIRHIGLAVPGPVTQEQGIASILPAYGLKNIPFKKLLEEKTDLNVIVGNDVNLATLAEYKLGAGRGVSSLYTFYPGTGIGGGYIANGKLIQGHNGTAGEVGHMVIDVNGAKCNCGQHGCLETIVSNTGLKRMLKEAIINNTYSGDLSTDLLSSENILTAWKMNDNEIHKLLKYQAEVLGIAIANVINITGVERIIVGGQIYHLLKDDLLPIVKRIATNYAIGGGMNNVEIKLNQLGSEAPALGATLL